MKQLHLKPVTPTPALMQMLENKGLIRRICPGHDELAPAHGVIEEKLVYVSAESFGPHQLLCATINSYGFESFGIHNDYEDFLFVGDPNVKPMYLLIALCMNDVFEKKIADGSLSEDDFVLLSAKYNDPEVSFFTMLKGVPHGEATRDCDGKAPSFYVTLPRDIDVVVTDFKDIKLNVLHT